ncbi:hypothetical protein FSP39_012447 [Pinctada imbricata]|uniref:DUF6589 domain-containing protein n=1 Tax=Pinctada imbricata TaxID=66713 RepID=A0AA88Y7K8_PINIB|nr:hypothetical protein FSP39_012447 [Pinctada imbricata]
MHTRTAIKILILPQFRKWNVSSTTLAGGNTALEKYGVLLGGDQLTRVRLDGAKDLRYLSPTPEKRFDHLKPIVCELWHLKQDSLEKLYKTFYKKESAGSEGTLSHLKNVFRHNDVNGKVKSNFRAHSQFINLVFSELVFEQSREVLNLIINLPPNNIQRAKRSTKVLHKENITETILKLFYFGVEEDTDDELFNYMCQLCQWALHFIALDDTASEGDISRVLPNLRQCIPYFFSHSKLSKDLVECSNYIVKCETSSPLTRMRILVGSFVNRRGGIGQNVEADLIQEHFVRHQKELIRELGANKT